MTASSSAQFTVELNRLVRAGIHAYGVGVITADLQNLAADMLAECDDKDFKKLAVKRFTERAGL